MAKHTIIGAGAVGSGTARILAEQGHDVVIITRSGSGPDLPGITRVAADATDADRLTELAAGSEAIYNCANPPAYDKWAEQWPPLANAILAAAERTGARLVTMGNLYGSAAGSSPMRATDPLDPPTENGRIRVRMWEEALAAHDAGRVQITEVRASDYVGPGLGDTSHLADRFVPPILAGKTARTFGPVDVPHSWTYMGDVCRTMAAAGTDPRSVGRAWHVPTLPPKTIEEMASAFATAAGAPTPKVAKLPRPVLRLVGVFVPMIRALLTMAYQFDEPFEIAAEDTTATFGIEPTPFDEQIAATLESYGVERVSA